MLLRSEQSEHNLNIQIHFQVQSKWPSTKVRPYLAAQKTRAGKLGYGKKLYPVTFVENDDFCPVIGLSHVVSKSMDQATGSR